MDKGVMRSVEGMKMKGLMKASYGASAMWRGWRVYVGECAGSRSLGRPRKRWSDTVKECLRKRGLNVRQPRRMVQDSEWWGFVRGSAWEVAWRMNP